jgi:hypothetical protein
MSAIYESEDTEDAKKRGIWFGRLVSDKREYKLLRQSDQFVVYGANNTINTDAKKLRG